MAIEVEADDMNLMDIRHQEKYVPRGLNIRSQEHKTLSFQWKRFHATRSDQGSDGWDRLIKGPQYDETSTRPHQTNEDGTRYTRHEIS